MATHEFSILGDALPDASGNVYPKPSSLDLANDLYPHEVIAFKDSGTKTTIGGRFEVPNNYVGSPKLVAIVMANATTGDVVTDVDYRAIADAESYDPSTHQESVTATTAVPGTAFQLKRIEHTLTAGNFAAKDVVAFLFGRDGAQAADTLAAELLLVDLRFQYTDA